MKKLLVLFILLPIFAFSQTKTISGLVNDENNMPLIGVNITVEVNQQPIMGINVTPASEQQAQDFSRSNLGRQLSSSMEIAPAPEAGEYVKKRSADILSEVLANATDPNLYGGGYYDIGKMYRPQ